jgi:hypothetical protein
MLVFIGMVNGEAIVYALVCFVMTAEMGCGRPQKY